MINTKEFIEQLILNDINFFTGVPDSLLSGFSESLHFDFKNKNHVISANEGSAAAIAMGHHLSTGKIPAIYMQNSGLGNFVNPYVSLMHKEIYNIPFLLIVGWRGNPEISDEPQHLFQGKITIDLLELLEIPYLIIDGNTDEKLIFESMNISLSQNKPFALIVKKDTFSNKGRSFENDTNLLTREDALVSFLEIFDKNSVYISTTGKLSRELYKTRLDNEEITNDFYTVGGMGHASAISLGIALNKEEKTIVCLDGDGSALMHLGNIGTIGAMGLQNFYHVLFNNSSHESVGGQPNVYKDLKRKDLFYGLNYKNYVYVENKDEIKKINISELKGPTLIEVKVQNSSDKNLIRPDKSPVENKKLFRSKLNKG